MSKTVLWGIIILLVALNIGTFTTIIYHKCSCTGTAHKQDKGPHIMNNSFFKDSILFDSSQMQSFRKAKKMFKKTSKEIISLIDSLKRESFAELNITASDTNKLDSLSILIGSKQTILEHLLNDYYLELKAICKTPEQLEKIKGCFFCFFVKSNCKKDDCNSKQNDNKQDTILNLDDC